MAVFLFPHLILQHFFQLASGLWICHLHLRYVFAEWYPSALFMIILTFLYTKRCVDLCLQMFGVFFFFTLKSLLLDVVFVNLTLLMTCALDSRDVAQLFY